MQFNCPADIDLTGPLYLNLQIPINFSLGIKTHIIRDLYQMIFKTRKFKINRVRQKRLQEYLIALDADLAGLSYREIAIRIWGKRLIFEDWNGGQGYLKNRVRRYVARGHYYMNGGYLDLLKK